jgi:hypothetical protein
MANTYTLIASSTVGSGGTANIEFTSIPSTYTDLLLSCSVRTNQAVTDEWVQLTFNNVGGTSYNTITIRGNGSTTASGTRPNDAWIQGITTNGATSTASTFASGSVYIPKYTSTTINKSVSIDAVMENNATYGYTTFSAGILSNTAAITSIKLTTTGGSFVQYSTAYLYGISNS